MKTITRTTTAGIVKDYPVTIQQFESVDEARAAFKEHGNPDEVLLALINKAQEQNAMQGPKSGILEAVKKVKDANKDASDADVVKHEDVVKAVKTAQGATEKYILGAPRAAQTGGVTRKVERETLDTLRNTGAEMSDEDMVRAYLRMGLPIPSAMKKIADRIRAEG